MKLKCTSITLIVLGFLGVLAAGAHSFGARYMAEKMVYNAKHPYMRHWGHHNQENSMQEDMNAPVSRDEFKIYDLIRNMSFLQFICSLIVLIMGCKGLKLSKKLKAPMAQRIFKCSKISSIIVLGLLFILGGMERSKYHIVREIESANMQSHLNNFNLSDVSNKPHCPYLQKMKEQ